MKRELTDLLRRPQDLVFKLRSTLFGGTVAALGLLGNSSAEANLLSAPSKGALWLPAVIVDRSRKTAKLVLHFPGRVRESMAQHRSHSSHSSHRSHSSHSSHYSGSVSTPAPPPPPAPLPLVAPRKETFPPTAIVGVLAAFDATVESIDRKAKSFVVKSISVKSLYSLQYRDDTTYETRDGVANRLDEIQEQKPDSLPFAVGDKVRISWKLSSSKKKTIAVTVTQLPQ